MVRNFRFTALMLILLAVLGGYFIYSTQMPEGYFGHRPFKLGLDLAGGTHLLYQADTSKVPYVEVGDAMEALRATIENRVNVLGVSEALVQTQQDQIGSETVNKLIVELPGVTDTDKAIAIIGATPVLEFKLLKDDASTTATSNPEATTEELFNDTGITGRLLSRADLRFDPTSGTPSILLTFNDEGKTLFGEVTKNNIGKVLAIFLDGRVLSSPVIQDSILDGKAVISGNFKPQEAKELVRNLNYGALPLPISLLSIQTVGASLGQGAVDASVYAGILSFIIVGIFLVIWYRLPGLVATVALAFYTILNLVIFKLIPVTLTSAGLAAFILSIGMAVDANILIFERVKEELRRGLALPLAIKEGFNRAWLSIRDSNLSSIITGVILYYFATSTLIKGFAFVFVIGVITSMFTAITVSRTLLLSLGVRATTRLTKFLFGSGIGNK